MLAAGLRPGLTSNKVSRLECSCRLFPVKKKDGLALGGNIFPRASSTGIIALVNRIQSISVEMGAILCYDTYGKD
jgi:hypothetical protein